MTGLSKSGWVVLALFVAACGGNATTGGSGGSAGSGGSSGGSGGTAGTAGSGGSGGTSPSGCPASAPAPGKACSTPNLQCTYGDTVRPECRSDWACVNGQWAESGSVCQHYTGCPAAPPPDGTQCPTEGMVCDFPAGTLCLCSACSAGPCSPPPPHWQCAPPPTTPGCPAIVPNNGSKCSAPDGTKCQYGNPCGPSGAIATCTGGTWTWQKNIACGA